MRQLAAWMIGVWLVSAATVSGAVLWGHAYPEPDPLKSIGLDICDGKPCFRGIIPYETPFEQARSLLREHLPKDPRNRLKGDWGGIKFSVVRPYNDSNDKVGIIYLINTEASSLTMGRIIEHFGKPCYVEVDAEIQSLKLWYPEFWAQVSTQRGYLTIDHPVVDMTLWTSQWSTCQQDSFYRAQWIGFASLRQYEQK